MDVNWGGCSSADYARHAERHQVKGRSAVLSGAAVGWQLAPGGRAGAPTASGAVVGQGGFASVERVRENRAEAAATG